MTSPSTVVALNPPKSSTSSISLNTLNSARANFINNNVQERAENIVSGLAHGIGEILDRVGVKPYPLDRFCNYAYEMGKSFYAQVTKFLRNNPNPASTPAKDSALAKEKEAVKSADIKTDAQVLARLYPILQHSIEKATKIARKNNKPLLVLVGEEHHNVDCAFKLSLIFRIFADRKDAEGAFSEYFHPKSYDHRNKTIPLTLRVLGPLTMENGLNIIPVDLARCEELNAHERAVTEECNKVSLASLGITKSEEYSSRSFEERVVFRNKIMVDEMILNKGNDAIAIVGAGHLKGLLKDNPNLSQHYEILAISLVDGDDDDESEEIRFLSSDQILSIPEKIISIKNKSTIKEIADWILQKTKLVQQYYSNKLEQELLNATDACREHVESHEEVLVKEPTLITTFNEHRKIEGINVTALDDQKTAKSKNIKCC